MRCLYGALACLAWIVLVVWFSLGVLIQAAVLGLVALPLTAAVLALLDRSMVRWQRALAIGIGAAIPLLAVAGYLYLLSMPDQFTF
jgi:hypothetical protein